ncbi:uncharacterized protein [Erythrolamprus reginae]|uniref:uncharacterized protein isoform X2 n=1 Tax=Erythrolamprus reginae TaxID=121349 RepID=UPI00396CDE1F
MVGVFGVGGPVRWRDYMEKLSWLPRRGRRRAMNTNGISESSFYNRACLNDMYQLPPDQLLKKIREESSEEEMIFNRERPRSEKRKHTSETSPAESEKEAPSSEALPPDSEKEAPESEATPKTHGHCISTWTTELGFMAHLRNSLVPLRLVHSTDVIGGGLPKQRKEMKPLQRKQVQKRERERRRKKRRKKTNPIC